MTKTQRSGQAGAAWACPFCGSRNERTRDHVWPRWLRNYPMYEAMNDGYAGQRFEETQHAITQDADGLYREVADTAQHVAEFLPHLQVGICQPCNNGWMSRMENTVQHCSIP
jgi:hypothetical protein